MKIGEKIRLLRTQKGISPEKLGLKIGMSGIYIRRLEREERRSITIATAQKLAGGLGVPVSALLDEQELPELSKVPSKSTTYRSPITALEELDLSMRAYIPVYGEIHESSDGMEANQESEPIDYISITRHRSSFTFMSV